MSFVDMARMEAIVLAGMWEISGQPVWREHSINAALQKHRLEGFLKFDVNSSFAVIWS